MAVHGDTLRELTETFSIRLTDPNGATLADSTSKITILGEEGPLTLAVSDNRIVEGDSGTSQVTFTLTLDEAPVAGESVTVRAASADGSATRVPTTTDWHRSRDVRRRRDHEDPLGHGSR